MKLKLDLHTHCYEASGYVAASLEVVKEIVFRIKNRGLDGIAVTEHYNKDYGFRIKEIVTEHFHDEVLIIPGQEVDVGFEHVVELYLPNNTVFKFLAHPAMPGSMDLVGNGFGGIEVANALHGSEFNGEKAKEIAERHGLLMLRNSDAHFLQRIGYFYNEIDLEELYARAKPLVG